MKTTDVPAAVRPGTSCAVQAISAEVAATNPQPKSPHAATATRRPPGEMSAAVATATAQVVNNHARDAGTDPSTRADATVAVPPTPSATHARMDAESLAPEDTRCTRP